MTANGVIEIGEHWELHSGLFQDVFITGPVFSEGVVLCSRHPEHRSLLLDPPVQSFWGFPCDKVGSVTAF
jgi:hypothetical protein